MIFVMTNNALELSESRTLTLFMTGHALELSESQTLRLFMTNNAFNVNYLFNDGHVLLSQTHRDNS